MKALQIIESAYRGTLEEQDDTIVWLTHSMHDSGATLSVLLGGNAVCYALKAQDAGGLQFGTWRQTNPPRIGEEIAKLIRTGVPVYVVHDDLGRRGIDDADLVEGVTLLARAGIPDLIEAHDRVWHW